MFPKKNSIFASFARVRLMDVRMKNVKKSNKRRNKKIFIDIRSNTTRGVSLNLLWIEFCSFLNKDIMFSSGVWGGIEITSELNKIEFTPINSWKKIVALLKKTFINLHFYFLSCLFVCICVECISFFEFYFVFHSCKCPLQSEASFLFCQDLHSKTFSF